MRKMESRKPDGVVRHGGVRRRVAVFPSPPPPPHQPSSGTAQGRGNLSFSNASAGGPGHPQQGSRVGMAAHHFGGQGHHQQQGPGPQASYEQEFPTLHNPRPDGQRRKRQRPTQIPIQAIQNDNQRPSSFPIPLEGQVRAPIFVGIPNSNQVLEGAVGGIAPSAPRPPPLHSGGARPPPGFQPLGVSFMEGGQFPVNSDPSTSTFRRALHGLAMFHEDFGDSGSPAGRVSPSLPTILPPQIGTKPRDFPGEVPTFDIPPETFQEVRPIINYVKPNERTFTLFEDSFGKSDFVTRSFCDVNKMRYWDPKDICQWKLHPSTLNQFPINLRGKTDEHEIYSRLIDLEPEGRKQSAPKKSTGNPGPAGAYGLKSLQQMLSNQNEEMEKNPMSYLAFMGMNLDKVMSNFDSTEPILPTFAGPLADRNHLLDCSSMQVTRSFPEYDLPCEPDGDEERRQELGKTMQMKKSMLKKMTLDTLLFIFYTMTGEVIQLLAGAELHKRGCRYHKSFQVWLVQDEGGTAEWVSGFYKFFNYHTWKWCRDSFSISSGCLMDQPPEEASESAAGESRE